MTCQEALLLMRPVLEGLASNLARSEAELHYATCGECGAIWKVARESTCRDLAGFLQDYLDGTLQGEAREVFERHKALCGECDVYLQTYRATIALCAEQPDAAPCREPIPDALVAAILAARAKHRDEPA